ncbi:sulfatase [Amnibacterium endophyticum]|uniref:Sulfatase-like hydrolase/transferase n=1 Tax=Amnibacterium endophyticum TaxID=2109337 RepID=A0ABW4LHC2_9MICO
MRRAIATVAALASVLLLGACSSPTPGPSTTAAPVTMSAPQQVQRPVIKAGAEHPNFVFVLADDYAMNLVKHMPQLQKMQVDGRTMNKHFVVNSLCCPSRSSIFTGRYPHSTGVFTNAGTDGGISGFHHYGDQKHCFAVAMQKAGYRTAFMGKYLNGYIPQTMKPEPGWDEWVTGGGGGYAELGYTLNENGVPRHYGHRPQDYMVDVLSRKAAGFIRDTAPTGQPFMLEVATYAPHDPYVPPKRYVGTMAHVPYPRTPAWNATVQDAPKWLRGHYPLTSREKAEIRRDWERRLEADLAIDDLIGNLRKQVAASGIERDTYVVFTSDNGLHMGEYRLTPGKETAFDTDVQVPLVVTGPRVPAGTSTDLMSSSIDIAPTFLDLSGVGTDPKADGVSAAPLWLGQQPKHWQQAVLLEHHHRQGVPGDPDLQNKRGADPPGYAAVRTKDSLYVRYADGEQEYYDLRHDPYELHDRVKAGVPSNLVRALHRLTTCSGRAQCQAAARLG